MVLLHKLILHTAVSGTYCGMRVALSLGKGISEFPRKLGTSQNIPCTDVYHSFVAAGRRMWGDMCPDAHGKTGNLFSNPSATLL